MKLYRVRVLWTGSDELLVVSDISEVFAYYQDKPVVVESIKWEGYVTVLRGSEVADNDGGASKSSHW